MLMSLSHCSAVAPLATAVPWTVRVLYSSTCSVCSGGVSTVLRAKYSGVALVVRLPSGAGHCHCGLGGDGDDGSTSAVNVAEVSVCCCSGHRGRSSGGRSVPEL